MIKENLFIGFSHLFWSWLILWKGRKTKISCFIFPFFCDKSTPLTLNVAKLYDFGLETKLENENG